MTVGIGGKMKRSCKRTEALRGPRRVTGTFKLPLSGADG